MRITLEPIVTTDPQVLRFVKQKMIERLVKLSEPDIKEDKKSFDVDFYLPPLPLRKGSTFDLFYQDHNGRRHNVLHGECTHVGYEKGKYPAESRFAMICEDPTLARTALHGSNRIGYSVVFK